jgi:hypothetical protein
MELEIALPPELQDLLNAGTLRRSTENTFAIDALRHRERTWLGWSIVTYELRIDVGDDEQNWYEIAEETMEIGEDIVLATTDADEAASWITELIDGKEN